MRWRRWGAISVGVLALAALIAGARPARLRLVRVTHVSAAMPPVASMSLRYARGARPQFVVLDVVGAHGAMGSATIGGDQEFVEAPLAGVPGGPYRIDATLAYRIGGFLMLRQTSFVEEESVVGS
ncbi:hypothetical protein [Roseiflexus castenholzii]|uniref:Uncharacterized protein n=1 Tax=Roseiflexus castenholzii (strain DSM 13941 / HLO8) TaxID=383372 RepID=A7NQY3_ROSCS|nr:hypothetical protein [Roseiflexus castenholzii]ABU59979.1 conserved hypothetical protein [Roseiflexus castenholzii DSM 13941]